MSKLIVHIIRINSFDMKAIFLKYMKVNWNDGWTFHFNLRFKLWYLFDRTFGKCIFLPLVLKTESDLILILTKKRWGKRIWRWWIWGHLWREESIGKRWGWLLQLWSWSWWWSSWWCSVDDDDDDAYQQVGSWSTEAGLDIKDIVWPNESRVPPKVRIIF